MSEKYTITKQGQHGRTKIFKGDKQKFVGSFEDYFEALEIINILNEEENRKSLPKIDKECIDYLLEGVDYQIGKTRFTFEQTQNMKKIIKSLRSE